MKTLFQLGHFDLHSGGTASWKIDCDALTDADLEAIALMIVEVLPSKFGSVRGIPTGGDRISQKLAQYTSSSGPVLIVDDVLTTGASMYRVRNMLNEQGLGVCGAVIFARGPCPSWIKPLFAMPPRL